MALTIERMTNFAGPIPARGTYPIAANVRIFKGALVCIDVAGRARPGGTIAAGSLSALGKASATYDNRTGSALGGAAGACDVEVEFGVYQWANSADGDLIAVDDVGKVCFVVDDQTVALTSNTDTRGICGFISEVIDGRPYVWMGPHVVGLIVIAASEASQLDTAQTDIDAAELRLAALETDAKTAQAQANIPLMSFVDIDGDPLLKFSDGVADGFTLLGGKAFGYRFNNGTTAKLLTSVVMPQDYDDTAAVVLHFMAAKVGATAADTPAFVTEAFAQTVGAVYDADVNFGGSSAAMANPASTTVQEVTLSLAAGDVPASPAAFTLTIVPNALTTDDLVLHGVWLEYTRKQMAS